MTRLRRRPQVHFIAVTLCALASSACGTRTGAASPPQPRALPTLAAAATLPHRPVYAGAARVDPASGHLAAEWRISFMPDEHQRDSVILLLNPALDISRLDGDHVSGHDHIPGRYYSQVVVHFDDRLQPARPVVLHVAYAGVPRFPETGINAIGTRWVELALDGFWHPVFADFRSELTARVQLTLPAGWTVVSSGHVRTRGTTTTIENDLPLIDVPFAASPELRLVEGADGSIHHVSAEPAVVERVQRTSAACASYLNARYGQRETLPKSRLVLAPRRGPGYYRQNYFVITNAAELAPEPMAKFLCHELAHFWSRGANSSTAENWLNEGLAEFISVRYVREAFGDSAYRARVESWRSMSTDAGPVWRRGTTTRPSAVAAYRKAPLILAQLEERIGAARMERVLERYMTERIATTPELLAVVAAIAGEEAAQWLEGALGR